MRIMRIMTYFRKVAIESFSRGLSHLIVMILMILMAVRAVRAKS